MSIPPWLPDPFILIVFNLLLLLLYLLYYTVLNYAMICYLIYYTRYLLEYAVVISLYLMWLMMYLNLSGDFASHLVFRSGDGMHRVFREFLR
jgi:hypothetical protein